MGPGRRGIRGEAGSGRAFTGCLLHRAGDKVTFTSNGKERAAFVELDPAKEPRIYDLLRDDGFISLRAIYAWDGDDAIKICAADNQGERPTEFETRPGSRNRIRVWKRQK